MLKQDEGKEKRPGLNLQYNHCYCSKVLIFQELKSFETPLKLSMVNIFNVVDLLSGVQSTYIVERLDIFNKIIRIFIQLIAWP